MTETAIAKCGHEVNLIAADTECEEVPDCCAMCDELAEAGETAHGPFSWAADEDIEPLRAEIEALNERYR